MTMNQNNAITDFPDGLLFDLDGVLADVSLSYRRAIIETADSFGVLVEPVDIDRCKQAGNANNDGILTYNLLVRNGINVGYDEVESRFQSLYLGESGRIGLRETESLLVEADLIPSLAEKYPLALVTGRPREEAAWFLRRFDLTRYFRILVGMEDAPAKPDPKPVQRALRQLNISNAWMIGDTPDDVVSAVAAGIKAVGITDTLEADVLVSAGAFLVLTSANELADILL